MLTFHDVVPPDQRLAHPPPREHAFLKMSETAAAAGGLNNTLPAKKRPGSDKRMTIRLYWVDIGMYPAAWPEIVNVKCDRVEMGENQFALLEITGWKEHETLSLRVLRCSRDDGSEAVIVEFSFPQDHTWGVSR